VATPGPYRAPVFESDLALAQRLADVADGIALRDFTGSPLVYTEKPDGSPVTATDPEIEAALRAIVAEERHGDAFLGEEVGATGSGPRRWIVDGIDGTIVFVGGGRGWSTEIALEVDDEVVVGVSTAPALPLRLWARRGGGAAGRSHGEPVPRLVSGTASLDGARFSAIPPVEVLDGNARVLVEPLLVGCTYVPPDTHCAVQVVEGTVDLGLQLEGGPWDFAALSLIVEEAGGRFSDLEGRRRIDGGGPRLYSNGLLHDAALERLRGSGRTG
jgi:histidinol-phosphatase